MNIIDLKNTYFSCQLPVVFIESEINKKIVISFRGHEIDNLSLSPIDGKIRLDLLLYEKYFEQKCFPIAGAATIDTLTISVHGVVAKVINVIYGKVRDLSAELFLKHSFMTSRPLKNMTNHLLKQFLSYANNENRLKEVRCIAIIDNEESHVNLSSISGSFITTIDASYSAIQNAFDKNNISFYKIAVFDGLDQLTDWVEFYYSEPTLMDDSYCFTNQFGAIDTATLTGDKKVELELNSLIFQNRSTASNRLTKSSYVTTKSSGIIDNSHLSMWMSTLITSPLVWLIDGLQLHRIIVQNDGLTIDFYTIADFSIKYIFAENPDIPFISKNADDVNTQIEIIEPDFTLHCSDISTLPNGDGLVGLISLGYNPQTNAFYKLRSQPISCEIGSHNEDKKSHADIRQGAKAYTDTAIESLVGIVPDVGGQIGSHNEDSNSHADIRQGAKTYTDTAIESLVGIAPEELDSIWELAHVVSGNQDVIEILNSAITEKSDKAHTHQYLPLSGGTLTGSLTVDVNQLVSKNDFFSPTGGGHARSILNLIKKDGSTYGRLGSFGSNADLVYLYLGVGGYNSENNLRIFPSGITQSNGFTKYNSSNSYFLLGGGGHVARSAYAPAIHNHTSSQITDFAATTKGIKVNNAITADKSTTLKTANWEVKEVGTELIFYYGNTIIARLNPTTGFISEKDIKTRL